MKISYFYRFFLNLYAQIILAIFLGVFSGLYFPELSVQFKFLGEFFIKTINLLIAPVIFCTVVIGIAGMEDMKRAGKTSLIAVALFESISILCLCIGFLASWLTNLDLGKPLDIGSYDLSFMWDGIDNLRISSPSNFILNIVPLTIMDGFAKGEILQVLFIAILFGVGLHRFSAKGDEIFDFLEKLSSILFDLVNLVMKLSPIGVFGALSYAVASYGSVPLLSLGKLIGVYYLICFLFVFLVLGFFAKLNGISIFKFLNYIKQEILVVFGITSSQCVFPKLMEKLVLLGARKSIVGIILPIGYTFNLCGTSIYLGLCSLFLAGTMDIHLSLYQITALLLILLVNSKGLSGVPGAGFIVLTASLSAFHEIPLDGLVYLFIIDRFMAEGRSITNLIGNGLTTLIVANLSGGLDQDQLNSELKK